MEDRLLLAMRSLEECTHPELNETTRQLATDGRIRIEGSRKFDRLGAGRYAGDGSVDIDMQDVTSIASNCCGLDTLPGFGENFLQSLALPSHERPSGQDLSGHPNTDLSIEDEPVRTFLLADARTGRRFVVPCDPSGGRSFNDPRVWCYRRGRFCHPGEDPDPTLVWNEDLQRAYEAALSEKEDSVGSTDSPSGATRGGVPMVP